MAKKSHKLESIAIDAKKPIKDKALAGAVALWNGLAAHGPHEVFSKSLTADEVRAALVEHLAARKELATAGKATKVAVSTAKALGRGASKVLTRLESLVGNAHPEGDPARPSFFVAGEPHPTPAQRLDAMCEGIKAHGLALPPDLSLDGLKKQLQQLTEADGMRASGKTEKKDTGKSLVELHHETAGIRNRLTKGLQGWFGRSSAKLKDYGITPRADAPRVHHRAAKPSDPAPSGSPPTAP